MGDHFQRSKYSCNELHVQYILRSAIKYRDSEVFTFVLKRYKNVCQSLQTYEETLVSLLMLALESRAYYIAGLILPDGSKSFTSLTNPGAILKAGLLEHIKEDFFLTYCALVKCKGVNVEIVDSESLFG